MVNHIADVAEKKPNHTRYNELNNRVLTVIAIV